MIRVSIYANRHVSVKSCELKHILVKLKDIHFCIKVQMISSNFFWFQILIQMSSSIDFMSSLIDYITGQDINSLGCTNNHKINICVFDLCSIEINALGISPQMHTFKVIFLSRRQTIQTKLAINFDLIKDYSSCLRFNDDS